MNPSPLDPARDTPTNEAPQAASMCPPFSPRRCMWELRRDAFFRWSLFAALVLLFLFADLVTMPQFPALPSLLMVVGIVLFIWVGTINGRVTQQLTLLTDMIEHSPEAAEALLARNLARRPLRHHIRLQLYHRLAMLRHRQQRYDQSAVIAVTLLQIASPKLMPIRNHLLLMLTEAQLAFNDLQGSYESLCQLHQNDLSLLEKLQRLALQSRYEVQAGCDQQALSHLPEKMRMIELLPGPLCGQVHAQLAKAAKRQNQLDLYDWLTRRAELLTDPEQVGTA